MYQLASINSVWSNIYELNWPSSVQQQQSGLLTSRHQSNTDINQSPNLLPVCKSTPKNERKYICKRNMQISLFPPLLWTTKPGFKMSECKSHNNWQLVAEGSGQPFCWQSRRNRIGTAIYAWWLLTHVASCKLLVAGCRLLAAWRMLLVCPESSSV